MAADTLEAAAEAIAADDLFLRLEAAGVMLRIDRSVTPTMAKTPTLARWELDRLRTIDNVVRLGHIRTRNRAGWCSSEGDVADPEGRRDRALRRIRATAPTARADLGQPRRSHCSHPGRLSLLRSGAGRLRGGHPRRRRGEEPSCARPRPYSNTPADWARMQVLGTRASMSFGPSPTSRHGRTGFRSTRRASPRHDCHRRSGRRAGALRQVPRTWPRAPRRVRREQSTRARRNRRRWWCRPVGRPRRSSRDWRTAS